MADEAPLLSNLIFGRPLELLTVDQRAELEYLLGLDTRDEVRYEQLAAEFPQEDGHATIH